MYIGIDFGTTNSNCAIYAEHPGGAGILPALFHERGVPTIIRYDSDENEWKYGEKDDLEDYPDDTIRDIKVKIRANVVNIDANVTSGGYTLAYRELLKKYLGWLIKEAVAQLRQMNPKMICEPVKGITVTVPCAFTSRGMSRSLYGQTIQKGVVEAYEDIIKTSVDLAEIGRPPVAIIEEPVAAAIAYLKDPLKNGREAITNKQWLKILVADLGGGTFDVTCVQCEGYKHFVVCDKEGDMHLGGNDFDEALLELVISKIKSQGPMNDNDRRRNLLRITKAKETLSKSNKVKFNGVQLERVEVTRQEFEDATQELRKRAMALIRQCVEKSGGIQAIDKIVLVGGGCQMPQIMNGIKELYPTYNAKDIEVYCPYYAIANGAAYYASMDGVQIDAIDDIATCTYGFLSWNGDKDHPAISNMIIKGMRFQNGKIEAQPEGWKALQDDQLFVLFEVFESEVEEKEVALDPAKVKRVNERHQIDGERFNGNGLMVRVPIPEEYLGRATEYHLDVKMILDSNGILTLEVRHDGKLIGSNSKQI